MTKLPIELVYKICREADIDTKLHLEKIYNLKQKRNKINIDKKFEDLMKNLIKIRYYIIPETRCYMKYFKKNKKWMTRYSKLYIILNYNHQLTKYLDDDNCKLIDVSSPIKEDIKCQYRKCSYDNDVNYYWLI